MSWTGLILRCCDEGPTVVRGFITYETTAANAKGILLLTSEFTALPPHAFQFERYPMATVVFVVGFIKTQLDIYLSLQ